MQYRAAARERPDFGDAYWSLANLKTYRFTDAELECMRAAEAEPATGLVDRYHLCFALGKAYEDRGEYAESWGYYERGNALKRAESRYRPELDRTQHREPEGGLHAEILRAAPGLWRREHGADLHRRTSPFGLDAD